MNVEIDAVLSMLGDLDYSLLGALGYLIAALILAIVIRGWLRGKSYNVILLGLGVILMLSAIYVSRRAMSLSLLKFVGQASLVDEAMLPGRVR